MLSVRETLQVLYKGYQDRKLEEINEFMTLFEDSEELEMLGISATQPGAYEWFNGFDAVKEIIISDWTYWGDVTFEVEKAHIVEKGDMAWFTSYGHLTQNSDNTESLPFFKEQMMKLFESESSPKDQMFEVVHFGIRRLLESQRGVGYQYPLTITGVLTKNEKWQFTMLHWAMPVD
jgi:hypothetical protein